MNRTITEKNLFLTILAQSSYIKRDMSHMDTHTHTQIYIACLSFLRLEVQTLQARYAVA